MHVPCICMHRAYACFVHMHDTCICTMHASCIWMRCAYAWCVHMHGACICMHMHESCTVHAYARYMHMHAYACVLHTHASCICTMHASCICIHMAKWWMSSILVFFTLFHYACISCHADSWYLKLTPLSPTFAKILKIFQKLFFLYFQLFSIPRGFWKLGKRSQGYGKSRYSFRRQMMLSYK